MIVTRIDSALLAVYFIAEIVLNSATVDRFKLHRGLTVTCSEIGNKNITPNHYSLFNMKYHLIIIFLICFCDAKSQDNFEKIINDSSNYSDISKNNLITNNGWIMVAIYYVKIDSLAVEMNPDFIIKFKPKNKFEQTVLKVGTIHGKYKLRNRNILKIYCCKELKDNVEELGWITSKLQIYNDDYLINEVSAQGVLKKVIYRRMKNKL